MKSDRRTRKTKESIKNAVIDLMENKSISGITVKAICEKADINRSTFYQHYSDVYVLIEQLERECVEELTSKMMCLHDGTFEEFGSCDKILSLINFIADNQKLCRTTLCVHSDTRVFNEILNFHQAFMSQELKELMNLDEETSAFISSFVTNAVANVIIEWLKSDMKMPADQLAHFLETIVWQGMKGFECFTPKALTCTSPSIEKPDTFPFP